jgi:thymidylate synthase
MDRAFTRHMATECARWGNSSFGINLNDSTRDQLVEAIDLLKANSEDRRVVISIWNPNLDLGTKSKDLPCNDLLMFKIRGGRLFQTIQNRSNDLHWGLPTNVFQFSFIGELMSKIIGVELGHQVHNSDSLHCYLDNPLTPKMADAVRAGVQPTLYGETSYSEMDFSFNALPHPDSTTQRMELVDEMF